MAGPLPALPSPDDTPEHPALRLLREQWARLGMPDPGQYDGIDVIEEALRLLAIPTPPSTNGHA